MALGSLVGTSAAEKESDRTRVGFYGCDWQVVKVPFIPDEDHKRPPIRTIIHCPSCGRQHDVKPIWRVLRKDEKAPKKPAVI